MNSIGRTRTSTQLSNPLKSKCLEQASRILRCGCSVRNGQQSSSLFATCKTRVQTHERHLDGFVPPADVYFNSVIYEADSLRESRFHANFGRIFEHSKFRRCFEAQANSVTPVAY